MEKNLFEELQERKQHVLSLAAKAKDYGWITPEREGEIRKKISEDVLTIGVIGQMKCGKSTVLNSIVFNDDILPSATTPMTAALSVITYGEKKKLKVEFYTKDEWEEQKMQASRPLDEVAGNLLEESKVKAAKDLVKKSSRLGNELNRLLGSTKEDNLEHLEQYVGADGKYVSVTKSVTIYYPKEYLKGVEIVDTPGFNDPIVSREERTKTFLNKADVVLLMLYAGRPFDATDRDILFKNVRQCGIGKVLVGINKYDIPYHNGEFEDDIKNYVKEEIDKACKACDDTTLVDILKGTEPIPLSAEMALLSELPMSKITANEIYREAWKRHCDDFEISSQPQMMEKSHLDNLVKAVKNVIEKEKVEILLRKPLSAIINAGSKKKNDIESEMNLCEQTIHNASLSDEGLEEKLESLTRASKRMNKKIDALGENINEQLTTVSRRGRDAMEDEIVDSCKRMDNIVEGFGRFERVDRPIYRLENEVRNLLEITLKRKAESIGDEARSCLQNCVNEFLDEISDVMLRYVPDFDTNSFITGLNKEITFKIQSEDIFKYGDDECSDDWFDSLLKNIENFFFHGKVKNELRSLIDEIRSTNVSEFTDSIMGNKDEIINEVKERVIKDMMEPLKVQLDELIANKDNRKKQLLDATDKLKTLQAEKEVIEKQLTEFE